VRYSRRSGRAWSPSIVICLVLGDFIKQKSKQFFKPIFGRKDEHHVDVCGKTHTQVMVMIHQDENGLRAIPGTASQRQRLSSSSSCRLKSVSAVPPIPGMNSDGPEHLRAQPDLTMRRTQPTTLPRRAGHTHKSTQHAIRCRAVAVLSPMEMRPT
jgi:hypothetical protein